MLGNNDNFERMMKIDLRFRQSNVYLYTVNHCIELSSTFECTLIIPVVPMVLAVQCRWRGTGRSTRCAYGCSVQLYNRNWSTNGCAGPSVHISKWKK